MERLPRTGERYGDPAGYLYQVIAVAAHADTGEQMVVYQAMFGDFGVWVRPLQQFVEEMQPQDEAKQPYTLSADGKKQVHMPSPAEPKQVHVPPTDGMGQPYMPSPAEAKQPHTQHRAEAKWPHTQSPAESKRALHQAAAEAPGEGAYYYEKRRRRIEEREQRREMFRKTDRHESATEELRANPCLMKFLEADTYEEKYHVLNEIQNDMTDRLIDDIAVVLDVVIPEGALGDRFHQLRNIILTRQKYETNRFR